MDIIKDRDTDSAVSRRPLSTLPVYPGMELYTPSVVRINRHFLYFGVVGCTVEMANVDAY